MMQAYIDTNILVDLVLARQEFLPDAQRVFALGYAGEVQLTVSALSFVNTVYLARKYKYPLDEVYSKLRLVADFVYVADLSGQKVLSGTVSDMSKLDGKTLIGMDVLEDAATNDIAALATRLDGKQTNVALADRTLYKDGAWNTLCLPFNVTISGSPLYGAVARPLNAASISGSTLNLTFGDAVDELVAGKPYIIKWTSGDNIVNPVFEGVTIDATERNYDNGESGDNHVRFCGTYKSTAFDSEDKSILLMGEENTLYYPAEGAGIGSFRTYFKIGDDGVLLTRSLTDFNIDFGDDDTTGLIEWKNGKMEEWKSFDSWYTLSGQKLLGKPTQNGIYINNGKKVVIK